MENFEVSADISDLYKQWIKRYQIYR